MTTLDVVGFVSVTFMLLCYACERRSHWFVLGFAFACVSSGVYAWAQGAMPIACVEAVWSVVAGLRWWKQHKMAKYTRERFRISQEAKKRP